METNGPNGSAPKVIVQYGSFIFALVCFTCVAAGGLFFLVWATAQGSAYAFDANKVSLIGLISTGLWASRAWAAIKRAEPDAIPTFRQKHRAFQIKAGTAIVGVIACAAMAGIYFGNRAAHKNKLGLLTKEVSDLGSKAAPIKQRFIQLRSETAQDLPGYLRRCSELEATLNDYEPALKQMDSLMSETQQELEELKTDSEYAEALPMVAVMRSVLKKDIEVAATYRKEIAYAKQLPGIPQADRSQFYDVNIQPVVDQEVQIGKDEIEIMKDAKARGIKLPESMYHQVGIN